MVMGNNACEIILGAQMPRRLGAGERIRTADRPLTRRMLCLLSYTGECPAVTPDTDLCKSTGSHQVGGTGV
jgi:hypothetical protein